MSTCRLEEFLCFVTVIIFKEICMQNIALWVQLRKFAWLLYISDSYISQAYMPTCGLFFSRNKRNILQTRTLSIWKYVRLQMRTTFNVRNIYLKLFSGSRFIFCIYKSRWLATMHMKICFSIKIVLICD